MDCIICTVISLYLVQGEGFGECSKALRIMAVLVVGGALASPNRLGNVMQHIFTLMSTVSLGE